VSGYGADTWCDSALQPGRRVTGVLLVGQALFRRITTPQMLLGIGKDETSYGDDITAIIGRDGERSVLTLPGIIRAAFLKDDRVADVKVDAFGSTGTDGMIEVGLVAHVLLADSGETFDMTLTATAKSVELGEVTAT
jgi:hypothetical protein